ncbi:hypothetical protein [Streptomyces sp. SH5]|nr:hypothetical protein [Streptomyces sp. SH5]WGP09752.1 hypothetical protein QFA72_08655 [Streptomyces sp. SH5]
MPMQNLVPVLRNTVPLSGFGAAGIAVIGVIASLFLTPAKLRDSVDP